jgi:integrase/recombinase XerC
MTRRRNPDRAGVVRHLTHTCGLDPREAERLIPKAAKGDTSRRALSDAQLAVYQRAVKREVDDPALRAVLLLLPRTGLRIAEITRLRRENIVVVQNRVGLRFNGKGAKERFVPLSKKAMAIMARYTGRRNGYLFLNARGTGPIPAARVQETCRHLAGVEPALRGLTPHVLRHTYASQGLARCSDMLALRDALGHGNARSRKLPAVTLTYLHPDVLDD